MVSLRFREFLPGYVGEEFDSLVAQLRSFFSISFNEDGTLQGIDLGLTSVPIGAVTGYAGATAPAGWLLCTGDAVSRITYKSLFEVIGTAWGAGDGSTTFNLPDGRGRMLLGKATSGTGSTLGGVGGAIDHTHSSGSHTHAISEEVDHTHTVDAHTHSLATQAAHTHAGTTDGDTGGGTVSAGSPFNASEAGHTHPFTTDADGAHDHTGATGAAAPGTSGAGVHSHGGVTGSGGGSTDAANPPFFVGNWIILAGA